MNIAILGAGNVGKALATSAVRAGHSVTITATNAANAEAGAQATGARAAASNVEALAAAELAVLAVPTPVLDGLVAEIKDHVRGKLVVDPTNRVNPNDPASALDGTSNGERVQAALPTASVIKAFNTLFASTQANPTVDGGPADAFYAGDDDEAKATFAEVARSMGFRPIDVGPLYMSRVLEGMALINILLQIWNQWPWQTAWKLAGPTGDAK